MDFREQLNASLVFMALFGAKIFENARTPPDTLQEHSFTRSPTALFGHLCLSRIRRTSDKTALFGHLSLSLTIRIKFNFTVVPLLPMFRYAAACFGMLHFHNFVFGEGPLVSCTCRPSLTLARTGPTAPSCNNRSGIVISPRSFFYTSLPVSLLRLSFAHPLYLK
jgi:hypothetical protein